MECICPNCGRKMESKRLVFDFTDFIKNELIAVLKEDNADSKIILECETLFNNCKDKAPLFESEERLWNLCSDEEKDKKEENRYVMYPLPYEQIFQRVQTEKSSENFKKWLKGKEEKIKGKSNIIWLVKTGDGKIHIDKVLDWDGNKITFKRQCPYCHGDMSYWSGRYREICLTVLGGPRVSKSTTLTACAAAFMESADSIYWEGADEDDSWKLFKQNYLELYKAGKALIPTDTSEDKIPRVSFKVTINEKKICLTFIDLPGEFNGAKGVSEEIYKKYKNFYDNIDFVWYCTDPGEVRQLSGEAKEQPQILSLGYEEKQEILSTEKLKSNMRNLSSLFRRSSRKVPVIYILGKTDAEVIDKEEKEKFDLFKQENSDISLPLDIREFYEQARKVKEYMTKYNPFMVKCFEECFEYRSYTAFSAYGYNPKAKNEVPEKKPYHCKLPFYWMLALKNCIEVRTVGKKTMWQRTPEEYVAKLKDLPEAIQQSAIHNLYMKGPYMI